MRIDGDRLDASDSYNSPWLGDEKGGSPHDVSSDGKIPVGLAGTALGKEVYASGSDRGKMTGSISPAVRQRRRWLAAREARLTRVARLH